MSPQFIDLTREILAQQHLCCIVRSKTQHPGVEAKRRWLADRLEEGHVFRKLDAKATVFIEYAPLETAWVPILGENYLYLYCLWVLGEAKGKGYGRALMESCLSDAKQQGKSGICMLGSEKQKGYDRTQGESCALMEESSIPMLLIQSKHDGLIDYSCAERFHEKAKRLGIKCELYSVIDKKDTHSWYTAGMFLETRQENQGLDHFFSWIEKL